MTQNPIDGSTVEPSTLNGLYDYENIFGFDRTDVVDLAGRLMERAPTDRFFTNSLDPAVWEMQDTKSRSRNYHDHSWDMLDSVLAAFTVTGEKEYIRSAVSIAVHWSALFANDDARNAPVGERHMAWYDMAVGLRAYRLAYILDVATRLDLLAADDTDLLWSAMRMHAAYLADDANIMFHNNHGFYQAAGQLAMGRRFMDRDPVFAHSYNQGKGRFEQMLGDQFGSDCAHLEHSPDYHRMVYRTARSVVKAGLIDDPAIVETLDCIERALSWFILPTGQIATIGDSDPHVFRQQRTVARREWVTEEMRHVVSRGMIGTAPTSTFKLFEDAGYCVARIPQAEAPSFPTDSYLVQQAGFHSRTHKHADTLSFVWADLGLPILIDPGRYGYVGKTKPGSELHRQGFWYSDEKRIYCESTRAHNCLQFDDLDYPRRDVEPFGSAVGRVASVDAQGIVAFESEVEHFPGVCQRRLLLLCAGEWLICHDWFDDVSGAERNVRQWFHFAPHVELEMNGRGFINIATVHERPLAIQPLLPVDGVAHFRGVTEPRLQGWYSRRPGVLDPATSINYEMQGRSQGSVATLISLDATAKVDPERNKISQDGRAATYVWTSEDASHAVTIDAATDRPLSLRYAKSER